MKGLYKKLRRHAFSLSGLDVGIKKEDEDHYYCGIMFDFDFQDYMSNDVSWVKEHMDIVNDFAVKSAIDKLKSFPYQYNITKHEVITTMDFPPIYITFTPEMNGVDKPKFATREEIEKHLENVHASDFLRRSLEHDLWLVENGYYEIDPDADSPFSDEVVIMKKYIGIRDIVSFTVSKEPWLGNVMSCL